MAKHLVFVGDSLTQWFDWQQRFPDYSVANLGISGESVQGLLNRIYSIHEQTVGPDYIFLMTGINNIAMEQYDITLPYGKIVRNLTTWYKKSKIAIQSILPVKLLWISNDVIKDTNRHLADIAREYNTEYLDVYTLFVDSKGNPISGYLSDDGVHLAAKGYEVWADEVEKFLKNCNTWSKT